MARINNEYVRRSIISKMAAASVVRHHHRHFGLCGGSLTSQRKRTYDTSIQWHAVWFLTLVLLLFVISCNPMPNPYRTVETFEMVYHAAPAFIDVTSPPEELPVNLVEFTGKVTPGADVLVNDVKVTVSDDGLYSTLLELSEGTNVIKVSIVSGTTVDTKSVNVSFRRPLALSLDWPEYDTNINYARTSISITGRVSDPKASVVLNGRTVKVTENGRFSDEVQLTPEYSSIQGIATLGTETAEDWLRFDMSGGLLSPVPGSSLLNKTRMVSGSSLEIKPGETGSLDIKLYTRNDLQGKEMVSYMVTAVGSQYGEDEAPTPEGLSYAFDTHSFSVYPNIDYTTTLTVASSSLTPVGEYWLRLHMNLGYGRLVSKSWIKVLVRP